jgi:hypothetical protein
MDAVTRLRRSIMPIPTDRGYVILSKDAAGTMTVRVSVTPPDRGRSRQVFAEHTGETRVAVDSGVRLVNSGDVSWSTTPVQVFVDSRGVVNIRPVHGAEA